MLVHYLTLGLNTSASEEDIRERYLQLVRRHPPHREPEKFERIGAAYEALKDERARIDTAIFGVWRHHDAGEALKALVTAGEMRRRIPGLRALLEAECEPNA